MDIPKPDLAWMGDVVGYATDKARREKEQADALTNDGAPSIEEIERMLM